MLVTEEEAKERWCPFVRMVQITDFRLSPPYNRLRNSDIKAGPNVSQCRCIASQCMAWRRVDTFYDKTDGRFLEPGEWVKDGHEVELQSKEGYCGLASKP